MRQKAAQSINAAGFIQMLITHLYKSLICVWGYTFSKNEKCYGYGYFYKLMHPVYVGGFHWRTVKWKKTKYSIISGLRYFWSNSLVKVDLQTGFLLSEWQQKARWSFLGYWIMESFSSSRLSQLQSLVLDRGSGFVELCCLAADSGTNLFMMDHPAHNSLRRAAEDRRRRLIFYTEQ